MVDIAGQREMVCSTYRIMQDVGGEAAQKSQPTIRIQTFFWPMRFGA
jgi:hypothetical protein